MKYEDVHRLNSVESAWVWLKMRFCNLPRLCKPPFLEPSDLSAYDRRDIGLPEPVRYADWKALEKNGWR